MMMAAEFHIFAAEGECSFTVRRTGFSESRDFPTLNAAARHLRSCAKDADDYVIVHDDKGKPNRIPLRIAPLGSSV